MMRESVFVDRRHPSMRWSAVLAGAVVSVGTWLLLQMLGVGVGLTAVETDDAGSLRGAALGTGIWTVIAPVLALFVGGLVAGRLSGIGSRLHNGLQGLVMWSLAMVLGLLALARVVGAVMGVAESTGRVAADSVAAVAGAGDQAASAGAALGLDAETMLAPINQRLREQGKPEVTAAQLEAVARDVARRSITEGRLDRELLVERVAAHTALDRADAEELAGQLEQKLGSAREQLGETGEDVKAAALTAADRSGKAMLWASLAMLLGLGAAVAGGVLGTRKLHRREVAVADHARATTAPWPPADDRGV